MNRWTDGKKSLDADPKSITSPPLCCRSTSRFSLSSILLIDFGSVVVQGHNFFSIDFFALHRISMESFGFPLRGRKRISDKIRPFRNESSASPASLEEIDEEIEFGEIGEDANRWSHNRSAFSS